MRRQDQFPAQASDVGRAIAGIRREQQQRAANLTPVQRRSDGTTAASLGSSWAWYDRIGNPVVVEDSITGGLALPYLPIPFAPARYTDWLATTNASFEDVHRATIKRLQPYAYLSIGHTTDVSGTTGELQVTVNGTVTGGTTTVTFTQAAVTVGPFLLPGAYKDQVEIRVQARRTAGTGNVRLAVLAASGIQS